MKTFFKAQLSSFTGGIVDYISMILLTELAGLFYSYSIIISGLIGATVNFYISRNWAFAARQQAQDKQLVKFACMVAGSIFLKSYGTHLLTTLSGVDYKISRLMVDLIVALGFNFPLQRYWIFPRTAKHSHV